MKADLVFGLENAAWPALVLNDSGIIQRANSAATVSFSGISETGAAAAASIWSPENDSTVEVFLAHWERASSGSTLLKLRTKDGATTVFQVYVTPFARDERRFYLLQLFKPSVAAPSAKPEPGARKTTAVPPAPDVVFSEGSTPEAAVAHRQKLDCALQLARTVALDFNNALTSILGHTSLILSKMEPNHPWRGSLVEVEKSAEKAAEVAADLAAFSRQEKDVRSQVAGNLNDLVRRTAELFDHPGTQPVSWTLELEPRLYTASFDEAKMQQAFVKILDNAVQALGAARRIVVRTRNQDVAEPIQDGSVRLTQGPYVCVEFQDSGCGIAPSVLPRVFEPFFTTKSSPEHRGLGLAWVYGIVTNHGGCVAVTSQVDRGTTVRVYLPAQKKIIRDRALPTDELNGTQTVLMVDDEEMLLTMGEMVLSSFGYRVLTANNGQTALELFAQNQGQIDLIITDLVMPKMSGRELIEQLRRLSPRSKIICSSGYVRALTAQDDELYLQKPFTSLDLLRKVKEALTTSDAC